jgi:formate-nitrite transporter family protein
MGEKEMARPVTLLWSGLAAGLSISLPVAAEFTAANLRKLLRLWAIVFAANLTGTAAAAVFCTFPPVLTPELRDIMINVSRQIPDPNWIESFIRAI